MFGSSLYVLCSVLSLEKSIWKLNIDLKHNNIILAIPTGKTKHFLSWRLTEVLVIWDGGVLCSIMDCCFEDVQYNRFCQPKNKWESHTRCFHFSTKAWMFCMWIVCIQCRHKWCCRNSSWRKKKKRVSFSVVKLSVKYFQYRKGGGKTSHNFRNQSKGH